MAQPRCFLDTEETFHFFDERAVLGVNELRSGDASSSSSDSDSSDSSHLRHARRRRRASSVVSRRTSRRLSQLLNGSVSSGLQSMPDDALSDSDEDFDSLDGFELEEEEDEQAQTRERKDSADNADAEAQGATPAAGVKVPGVGVAKFEQIFDPFRDLYMPILGADASEAGGRPSTRQQTQLRKARRAIAAFTRRVHCANGYRYRKQSEFMRVCYQRALEGGPGYELVETMKMGIGGEAGASEAEASTKQSLITASQKEDAVETTVPNLFPRKWPHLPFRSPLQWRDDTDAAVEFLSRLAELPETSLIYEPIDLDKFAAEVAELLESSGGQMTTASESISEVALTGLLGLLAMGVQLQSFTLLSSAALQFIELGQATQLGDESALSGEAVRPELRKLLDFYCSRLAKHAAEPTLAATYPRDLSAQWKVCSYQPSTSDAIATDGLYLYIFGRSGLLKVGTGNGTTVRDFVYAHNKEYVRNRDAERSWLCCIGDSLYCRTIVMPGHRVDRIRTSDLQNVQELVFAPNRALIGKGTTESSVYAMVTDGVDLITIRCIDTYEKTTPGKSSSNRKHRSRSHKPRKSTPVSEIVSAVLGKSDNESRSPLQSPDTATIKVGDRVVRGPDWKWSNQDGEKGRPGTVERISTWGGVKGSGVTVRWDKNQRVNTYRWGAEGCYDLCIVTEKDGQIMERKPLPNDCSLRRSKDGGKLDEVTRESEPEPLPRHQFVLYRHKVNEITAIMKLDESDIDLFLDLTPSGDERKQVQADSGSGVEIVTALHSHPVALCTSKTSWMCDGGMSNCFGDNAAKRYRCTTGCDYDLCEACLFAAVVDQSSSKGASDGADADTPVSDDGAPGEDGGVTVSDTDAVQSSHRPASLESNSSEVTDPFSTIDTSLFAESEREVSLKKTKEEKEKQALTTEEQMVDDLTAFWCGLYTRKECQVALKRNRFQLNEASTWLHTCGDYLREPMVIPTVSSVVLTAKLKSGALDPVLLIAGSFYATRGQLCVVSPPGLYTVGDDHSDMSKRAANSCDASWFFSLETGALLADKPVLLKGIPAGSPICVDMKRKRVLVFSGYLNCLEEYVDHVQQDQSLEACTETRCCTLADTGEMILAQIAQLMRKRAALPAYKHIRAGLQDILFRTGRESASASSEKQSEARGGSPRKDAGSGTKSRNRRIKNIQTRLKEVDHLGVVDRPGHIIPFCVDFNNQGLLQILRAISHYCGLLSPLSNDAPPRDSAPTGTRRLVANLLRILTETVQEFEFVGVSVKLQFCDEATQQVFTDVERALRDVAGRLFGSQRPEVKSAEAVVQLEHSEIVQLAHFMLIWGMRKDVFCSDCRSEFFASACESVVGAALPQSADQGSLPESYFAYLLGPHDSFVLQTKRDCDVDLLRRLLYSPMDDGRIAIADFVPSDPVQFSCFLNVLFALSKLESSSNRQRGKCEIDANGPPFQSPVTKTLHSVMNYCCARMYAVSVELPATKSLKDVGKEACEAITAFECFARACFNSSLGMLRDHLSLCINPEAARRVCDMQTSALGTILPMVIAFIPEFPEQFSDDIRGLLLKLMKALDSLICLDEKNLAGLRNLNNDAAIFGGYQVVETPHPYNHTQPVFRHVVHIPGATVLHFEFDPRCRTSGESDFVLITSGLAWYQADRLPNGDVGFGEDGGCFYGSYSRGNWPAGGLTVVGDTATIMLCVTTQGRSGTGDKQRWGLKCSVRGLFDSPRSSWISDLGCAVANACSVIGDKLLRGLPLQNVEKTCQSWAMQRQLFNLTAPTCNALKSGKWRFVNDVVTRTSRGNTFFLTLAKYVRLRNLPARHASVHWTKALQEAAAVLLVSSNHLQLLKWIASVETEQTLPDDYERQLFQRIGIELGKLERWMLRRVQLVSEWHYLRLDNVGLDELMERYADNLDRLSELCQLKGVVFRKEDMTGCVKSIHELLVKEIAAQPNEAVCTKPSGSHEAVARAVSAKAQFLLARWQKCVEQCTTYLESVAEAHYDTSADFLPEVGKFLCSTVTISTLEDCATAHTSRLKSRLGGLAYCKEAFTSLNNKDMSQFFVGRVLHAVPSSNLVQGDGIFSGCALADPHLLAQMMTSLSSYANAIREVSESRDELPTFRVVALADVWNCAHALNSTPSHVLGLEGLSSLIVALHDEMNVSTAAELGNEEAPRHADQQEVQGQVYNAAWILLRLFAEEVYEHSSALATLNTSPLERVFRELRKLYEHFGHIRTDQDGVKCSQQGEKQWIDGLRDEAIYRLLCTMASKVGVLNEWPEAFGWWIQNAIALVSNSDSPPNLSIAGTRLLRFALESLGDAMFDLNVIVGNPTGKPCEDNRNVVLGLDIQKMLLRRIGNIVSPLPHTDLAEADSSADNDHIRSSQNTSYCVVILRNELADDKLVDAANSVGNPDISSFEISVDVGDEKEAVEKAATEAVAECTAAQATMKHTSVRCDGCNQSPLRGFRFKCFTCTNYDLCTTCYTNQTHNLDHPFVRLSDATGTGDLLQPRSKGGGVVPETALVGSKPWKGSLLRVLLDSHGFVVYCSGSRQECCESASALAQLGFLVTVSRLDEMANVKALFDWESKVQFSLEPGSSRLSHRRSSSDKRSSKKTGGDVINAFNRKAAVVNARTRQRGLQIEDGRTVVSEVIAVLRLMISSRPTMHKWRCSSLKILTEVLEEAPRQLAGLATSSTEYGDYFVTLGATQVLGGFREMLRVGGNVSVSSYAAETSQGGRTDVIYSYAFGNDDIVIARMENNPDSTRIGEISSDDDIVFCKRTASEVTAVSCIPLEDDAIRSFEPLVVPFCAVIKQIYVWTAEGEEQASNESGSLSSGLLLRWELACALMQSFATMAPSWPSLFDNQVISTNGNSPAILFQLAQMCMRDMKMDDIAQIRSSLWKMEWLRSRELHFSIATRPISSSALSASDDKTRVLRPPEQALDDLSSFASVAADGSQSPSDPSEYFYNLYAFSSCGDLPQHTGRNKMLEYWEKNVIPAIETYVSGSFKSYEMDYFFAQLREPLREGNAPAALKIAFTLCDGHVPSGCHYPDPDTDWSALQIDDVEVGGRYVIASENVNVAGWPRDMLWTLAHSGTVRLINPSGMVLLQVVNPSTFTAEYWWYHVDSLRSMSSLTSITDQSVTDFEASRSRLRMMNQQLIYSIARKSVFDLLQVAPEHAMMLSIETKKTSLARTSSSPFPMPASSSVAHTLTPTIQLTTPLPKNLQNRYSLADLLRLAAAADLGCPEKVLASEMGIGTDATLGRTPESGGSIYLRPSVSSKSSLITVLQVVLNKQFERAAASPPPPVMDRSTSYDENASVMVTMPAKKHKKRGKQGALAGKLAAASSGTTASSTAVAASAMAQSTGANTSFRSTQPKLQQPELVPTRKHRYLLMEALLAELKASLDLSSAFLRSRSFMVTSDSPPEPLVLVHVPDATCLVVSFAVHPVLMDLPSGSSLEFFRDERCTDRLFGYFADKRGLSYLPPLVVPGDRCYVRLSQGTYARYKFRVDAFTADFGLALWLCEEIYQKLLSVQLSRYEVETILTTALDALVDYLVATSACLPSNAKTAVYQITGKLINFALGKGAMHAVPIAKLSGLVKELTFVYDNERTTQKGLYSLYTQQLAELISLVEEVSSLKGGSSPILAETWWKEFVRMAVFSRVLAQSKREIAAPDAFKRIYCGRAPIREVQTAHNTLASRDLFTERLILLQNLPCTSNVADLESSVSRFLVHLALEECGEADDQNVYTAAAVTRFGITSHVLYMPVDSEGNTKGYAIVDIGRADVISDLLARIPKETFEYEGGTPSEEDTALLAKIEAVCRPPDSSGGKSNDESDCCLGGGASPTDVWACSVCTLENSLSDAECAACGSPIPPEMANLAREVQAQSQSLSTDQSAGGTVDTAPAGWTCEACTFVNSWADTNCEACTMERSADLVPPSPDGSGVTMQEDGTSTPSAGDESTANRYKLSAARFIEMIHVADETAEVPEQVEQFLRHRLFQHGDDRTGSSLAAPELRDILQQETAQYCLSPDSKMAVEAFAEMAGVKKSRVWESMSADERASELTSPESISKVEEKPLAVYKWLRSSGYDLQFELSHYAAMDDAMQGQAKWTHQMDCQLIAVCRELGGKLGMLTLTELCPSHLSAKHAGEYLLLSSLETRDLRLRLAVLQSLNKLLVAALPLVNLRPWSDPSSLRSRIVSMRQLIFPGVKIRFFAQTQDNTTLAQSVFVDTNAKRPVVTIDRRKVAGKSGGINASADEASASLTALRDPKRSLFASTMSQLSTISPSRLRAKRPTGASDPFVSFIVIFAGENVVGEGGPYRQLFNDISNELLASGNPLFIPTQNNVMKAGEFRERYMPKPSSTSKELLQMFEFVGILMGCCLRTGVRLNLRLAPLVWKMLVKQSLVLADLETVDHSLCESLKFLEELASSPCEDPSEVFYDSFTTTLSDGTVVELKKGGLHIPVTRTNMKEYIRLVKATRLQECKPQVDAMLRGLGKIVPVQLLQLCVWSELQQWVSGSLEIDLELLKRHTRYSSGMSPEKFPHLEMFWNVLSGFSEENKRRFINFAWGQDTLPVDDAEFDRTHTRLLIKAPPQGEGINQDALLPKADTCFFNIELPVYSSEKTLREKLLLAITLCTSLDGDEQTAGHDIYYAGDESDDDVME